MSASEITGGDLANYTAELKEYVPVLFRQFDRVNIVYTHLDPENLNPLIFALNALEGTLGSFIDSFYKEDIARYKQEMFLITKSIDSTLEQKLQAELLFLHRKYIRLVEVMDEATYVPARNYADVVVHEGTKGYEYISKLRSTAERNSRPDSKAASK